MRQGAMYWLDLGTPAGSAPGYRRPYVVVQNDLYNGRRIQTTVVCALTTQLSRATDHNNVVLKAGEYGLSRDSVVVVSQLYTIDKGELDEYIGQLPPSVIRQVVRGLHDVFEPRDADDKDPG